MNNYIESISKLALNHISQNIRYSLLLGAVGLGYGCSWMNQRWNADALNHNTEADFDWDKEIVLITGGAGGIGGEVVQKMAKRGTTVIVLDVMELTYTSSTYCLHKVVCSN